MELKNFFQLLYNQRCSWMKLGFCGVVLIVVTPVNKNIMWLDILNPSTLTLQASTVFSVKSFVQIVILSKHIYLEITETNHLWYSFIFLKWINKTVHCITFKTEKRIFSCYSIKDVQRRLSRGRVFVALHWVWSFQ